MDKKTYNAKILPIVKELKQTCMENKLPFFACFFTGAPDSSEKEVEILSPNSIDINMADNTFYNYINVSNGFDTIPPHKTEEIDFDIPG